MPAVKDGEPVAPFLLRVAPPGRAERRRRVAAHRPAQLLRPPGARSDADADAEPGFEPEPELPTLRELKRQPLNRTPVEPEWLQESRWSEWLAGASKQKVI